MIGRKFNYKEIDILEALESTGILEALKKSNESKKPGMCLAQILDNGDIIMGFIDQKASQEIQKVMGTPVGLVSGEDSEKLGSW